jgi:phosphoribosylanthranilate isomerase
MNDVHGALDRYGAFVSGLLLDAYDATSAGGTGRRFDWQQFDAARAVLPPSLSLIAAGGLTPENVSAAIAQLHPDVVDVSSGVERVVGEKSEQRVHAFLAAVRSSSAATGV